MASKLTAEQQRRVDEILQFQRTVEHVAKLVAELEGNRAAKSSFIDNLCETIARELSQMRQRALTANIGTLGDVAGAMSVMAGRGGGGFLKIWGVKGGGASLGVEVGAALEQGMTPPPKRGPRPAHLGGPPPPAPAPSHATSAAWRVGG